MNITHIFEFTATIGTKALFRILSGFQMLCLFARFGHAPSHSSFHGRGRHGA